MRRQLWKAPEELIKTTNMYQFMLRVNKESGLKLNSYPELYRWSVEKPADFWGSFWHYLDIKCSKPYTAVVDDIKKFPGAQWFVGAELNYTENILRYHTGEKPAIIFRGENAERRELSRAQVYDQVTRLATALRAEGVRPGDAVAAYMPNLPETVIAMLATAAVGGLWCSCATDIGSGAAIDRVGQVKPKVLVTADGYFYKGKKFNVLPNAAEVAKGIGAQRLVVVHYAGDPAEIAGIPNAVRWEDYTARPAPADFRFEQLPASAPMVVMFSSGTTGKPKCMVQSAAGVMMEQLKELVLHHDLKEEDRMLYISTCSWMMWNWQLASLGAGACIVLYDGNPSYPETSAIWKVLEQEKVSIFGLSASYIHALLAEGFSPKAVVDLSALRCISQTGSALSEEGFEYAYREIKSDMHLNSIAGGTDINGCFCMGTIMLPVWSGELQAASLGMAMNCYDENGKPVRDTQGELVCELPEPSMPLYFWNDPENKRYLDTYFGVYPGIWRHGDYVLLHGDTGGFTFYGRSDSVLKPSGVRIGTAEIYNQVSKIPQVADSLAIGQMYHDDQRIILFVQTKPGVQLDEALKKEIKRVLRVNASPRHVPAVIMQAPDLPKTLNGKKVESSVTNILNGRKVTNRDALMNPESLDYFEQVLAQLQA